MMLLRDLKDRIKGVTTGLALVAALLPSAWAADVTLAWDANTEPDVAGYRVYYGRDGVFSEMIEVGNVTEFTVGGLMAGEDYSFYVTCCSTVGMESDPSNVVTHIVPSVPRINSMVPTLGGMQMRWDSVPGQGYRVSCKDSLSDPEWTVLFEFVAGGDSAYFVDYESLFRPLRFYRVDKL